MELNVVMLNDLNKIESNGMLLSTKREENLAPHENRKLSLRIQNLGPLLQKKSFSKILLVRQKSFTLQ